MKKILFLAAALFSATAAFAGGYLTNTNQSAAFVRNPARLATFELDGAYSNPAGLAWLGEGLHIAFNWQAATQQRDITSKFAPFAANINSLGQDVHKYDGNAKAPFIPSLQAAYQKKNWTVSLHAGVIGGGGKATFDNGLPMFEAPASLICQKFGAAGAKVYSTNMAVEGAQYIYGVQAGVTYKIFDDLGSAKQGLSVYLGARASIVRNHYKGHFSDFTLYTNPADLAGSVYDATPSLQAAVNAAAAAYQANPSVETMTQLGAAQSLYELNEGVELDCEQSGWGIAPIIGVDYRVGKLNIGARYEFMTNLSLENKTNKLVGETVLRDFKDGVKTDSDVPAILAIGAQYDIFNNWRVMAGWNMYFDKQAEMSGGKEAFLDHNTMEFQAGTEVDIKSWTISLGYQNTNYGMIDGFQSDLAFSCDSHLLNAGLRYNINKHFSIDAGYMISLYKDYEKVTENYQGQPGLTMSDIYSRENQAFALGVTWHM